MIGKDFVVKMSKNDRDARYADVEDCTFHSDVASLKTNVSLTPKHNDVVPYLFTTEPGEGSNVMFKIEHGYDHTPAFMAFIGDPSAAPPDIEEIPYFRTPFVRSISLMYGSNSSYLVDVDRHYLYFIVVRNGTVHNTVKGTTIYIKYSILDLRGLE